MKKFFFGLLFFLIAAVITIPYINGLLAEKAFTNGIGEMNAIYAESGSDLSLEIINYDRDFFSSTINWKVNVEGMDALYGIEEILITDKARHGFTGVTSETDLDDNKWFTEFVETKLDGIRPFEIQTFYSLTGNIQSEVNINSFTIELEGAPCTFKSAHFTASTDRHFKRFTSSGSWEGLSIGDILNLNGVTVNSDMTMITSIIWHGDADFTMKTASLKEEGADVHVQNLKGAYRLTFDQTNNSLSTGVSYKIGSVSNGLDNFKNLSVAFGINQIDANAYENTLAVYTDLITELADEIPTAQNDPQAIKDIIKRKMLGVGLQMMGVYEQLLKEGLEITITDLHADIPEGEIKGGAGIRLNQDVTLSQIAPLLHEPSRVFDFLSFHSEISIPKELIGEPPALLAPIFPGMTTGVFIESGQHLVHKAETREKKLYLNDVEFHLN